MSAPLRYARILNGLSSLISRRSAISLRMRAIAALSKPEALGFDPILEQARAASGERRRHRRSGRRRAVAEQTAAPARAAELGGGRTRGSRARDEIVNRRRGYPVRQAFPVLPFDVDLPADLVPVA